MIDDVNIAAFSIQFKQKYSIFIAFLIKSIEILYFSLVGSGVGLYLCDKQSKIMKTKNIIIYAYLLMLVCVLTGATIFISHPELTAEFQPTTLWVVLILTIAMVIVAPKPARS